MAHNCVSIQSFYQREVTQAKKTSAKFTSTSGDGFTSAEIQETIDPLKRGFNPSVEYEPCDIGMLNQGPSPVTFIGRVVNFNVYLGKSKSQKAATGWHHLIVKDDYGAICVTLYFVNKPYPLKLGLLVSVWTSFISNASTLSTTIRDESFLIPDAPIATSIFPGRDPSVHIIIHERGDSNDCRVPLHFQPRQPLPNLLTLKQYVDGGNEIPENRILVCVKSLGPKKVIPKKTGTGTNELQDVILFDETSKIVLKLWNSQLVSAKYWKPSHTILLISSPNFRCDWQRGSISLTHATMVDVDPQFADAEWLRRHAIQLTRRERVDQTVPEGLFDLEACLEGINRILFTLADVDEWVRNNPNQIFMGFLSLTIMDMALVLTRQRNMLMCTECCGVPIYANTSSASCKNCSKPQTLSLNPRIMGNLIDETGCIAPGKLLWSPSAWQDLFGRKVEDFVAGDTQAMKLMEQRLLYRRITIVFGWAEDVGRLTVLSVMESWQKRDI